MNKQEWKLKYSTLRGLSSGVFKQYPKDRGVRFKAAFHQVCELIRSQHPSFYAAYNGGSSGTTYKPSKGNYWVLKHNSTCFGRKSVIRNHKQEMSDL